VHLVHAGVAVQDVEAWGIAGTGRGAARRRIIARFQRPGTLLQLGLLGWLSLWLFLRVFLLSQLPF